MRRLRRYIFPVLALILGVTPILLRLSYSFAAPVDDNHVRLSTLGVLYNPVDSLSYAAWAIQNKFGFWTLSDLYTTQPHSRIYFNPYYFCVGAIARALAMNVMDVMALIGYASGPLLVLIVRQICLALSASRSATIISAFIVLLGTGPSGLIYILNIGLTLAHLRAQIPLGLDFWYLDLYPFLALLFYPYQATAFFLLALSVLAIVKMQAHAGNGTIGFGWSIGSGLLLGLDLMVRPYEPIVICVTLSVTALILGLYDQRQMRAQLVSGAICLLLAAPALLYQIIVSASPVWRDFAQNSLHFYVPITSIVIGYGIWWVFAYFGIVRAIREKQTGLIFMIVWAVIATIILIVLGGDESKFAGGAILAYGILGAYGLDLVKDYWRLDRILHNRTLRITAACAGFLGFISTPVMLVFVVFSHPAAAVDTDIIAAATAIRATAAGTVPIVLTDADTGSILPGLFGFRVYAGHWALTPDYTAKRLRLATAGFGDRTDDASFDPRVLNDMVSTIAPQYALVSVNSPALAVLLACRENTPLRRGARFVAVALKSSTGCTPVDGTE